MKQLIIVRHAKSSWKNKHLADRDRLLSKRGCRDAPDMGRRLLARGAVPQLLICSPAVRARGTAERLAEVFGYPTTEIREDEAIYSGSVSDLLNTVRCLDDAHQRVLLVGHNPNLTWLAARLARYPLDNLPTCAAFAINFPCAAWAQTPETVGSLWFYDYPKKPPGSSAVE